MLRFIEQLAERYDNLEAKPKLYINVGICTVTLAANVAFGVLIWVTGKALYPLTSGWTAFGFVWLLLIGASSILSNIAKGVIARSITAWSEYKLTRDYGVPRQYRKRFQQ